MSDPIIAELLARLETLSTRVDEQEAEIKRLKGPSGPARVRSSRPTPRTRR